MLDRGLVFEYWQDDAGRFRAQAREISIHAAGETLAALRSDIGARIRDAFQGSPVPSVYDLVHREDASTEGDSAEFAIQPA